MQLHNYVMTSSTHIPPDIGFLGEIRGPDNLRSHPGVSASSAHVGGVLYFTGQAEIGDLDGVLFQIGKVNSVGEENWGRDGTGDREENN